MELMSLLVEDYYGLWEIVTQMQLRSADCAEVLRLLLDRGHASLFVRAEDSAPAVPIQEAGLPEPDLNDARVWRVPRSGERQLLVAATEAGQAAYEGEQR